MKIVELLTGINVPITNEEAEVFNRFIESDVIEKRSLTEREQILANQLVTKDVLSRKLKDGKIVFVKKVR